MTLKMNVLLVICYACFLGKAYSEHHYAIHTSMTRRELSEVLRSYAPGGQVLGEIQDDADGKRRIVHVKLNSPLTTKNGRGKNGRVKRSVQNPLTMHSQIHHIEPQEQLPIRKRDDSMFDKITEIAKKTIADVAYEKAYKEHAKKLHNALGFNDPKSKTSWQYLNDGTENRYIGLDLNVFPCYLLGLTGNGSNAVVVDDGLDTEHLDLLDNYDPQLSTNVADPSSIDDTSPRGPYIEMRSEDGHGTRCAGLIASVANNSICNHGIAYKAKVGAIRILVSTVTDIMTATAIGFKSKDVDMYTMSWGPTDDGQTMDLPRTYSRNSYRQGYKNGRKGRGSLYIVASGNGGFLDDNCGADGFVGAPEVIAFSALNDNGLRAKYSEGCSSVRASVPIGAAKLHPKTFLSTTSENNGCIDGFTGTSAAAPLAAGCMALLLDVNRELHVRDIEYLLSYTARIPNREMTGWTTNAAGLLFNPYAGFGVIDCYPMTSVAKNWTNIGQLCSLVVSKGTKQKKDWIIWQSISGDDRDYPVVNSSQNVLKFIETIKELGGWPILENESLLINFEVSNLTGDTILTKTTQKCTLDIVEKVIMRLQWKHICRGTLNITLKSPAGTVMPILMPRSMDKFTGPGNMTITSVGFLGEKTEGRWTVEIGNSELCQNEIVNKYAPNLRGTLLYVELEFWGSNAKNSGYVQNRKILDQFITKVGRTSMKSGQGTVLTPEEVDAAFEEQRWRSLRMSSVY